ncbi:hypothetical protein [Nocardia sp. NPDC003963]
MTTTYAELRHLLLDIGMPATDPAVDSPLEELEDREIPYALVDLGVAVALEADRVDDLEGTYQQFLEEAAGCSGGAVTVTRVRLVDDTLHFARNGDEKSWSVESGDIPDHLSVYEFIDELAPGDDRVFRSIPQMESGDASFYILATPVQAKALTERLHLEFD